MTPQQCAYTPPATVHITTDKENPYHDFLPVGATAPLFDLKTPTGSPLSLADLLKSNRAVLLNFTFAECGACVLELPTVKEIHKLKDKGLAVVAINLTDSREKAKDFLVKYQIPYPMGLDGKDGGGKEQVSNAYRAMSGGTNYLLSSQGKVLWRHSNINEVRLRCVLEANHISAFSKN